MTARLDWYGCATFRLQTAEGLTVFLDAYLDRVPSAEQSGVSVDDVTAADWILVGHSHFDHLAGAERIAPRTGARVVGSYESIRLLAEAGVAEEQLVPVAGGERVRLDDWTTVRVVPSLHSAVWVDRPVPPVDEVYLGEQGLTWQQRQQRLGALWPTLANLGPEVGEHLQRTSLADRGDGGVLIYVLETSEGVLLFQDTSGCWAPLLAREHPDVAILAAAGRGVRDGEPVQTSLARFIAEQAAALAPGSVILSHHDDWLPGFSHPTDTGPIRTVLATEAPESSLIELDYASSFPLFAP